MAKAAAGHEQVQALDPELIPIPDHHGSKTVTENVTGSGSPDEGPAGLQNGEKEKIQSPIIERVKYRQ